VKLLLDENISRRIVPALLSTYPGTSHVVIEGLEAATDLEVSNFARAKGFAIVSKDDDFVALSNLHGQPPRLDKLTLAEAKSLLAEGKHFAKGSMAPKIQAIVWYLEAGGKQALITNPENIGRALAGETGTWIVP